MPRRQRPTRPRYTRRQKAGLILAVASVIVESTQAGAPQFNGVDLLALMLATVAVWCVA